MAPPADNLMVLGKPPARPCHMLALAISASMCYHFLYRYS